MAEVEADPMRILKQVSAMTGLRKRTLWLSGLTTRIQRVIHWGAAGGEGYVRDEVEAIIWNLLA